MADSFDLNDLLSDLPLSEQVDPELIRINEGSISYKNWTLKTRVREALQVEETFDEASGRQEEENDEEQEDVVATTTQEQEASDSNESDNEGDGDDTKRVYNNQSAEDLSGKYDEHVDAVERRPGDGLFYYDPPPVALADTSLALNSELTPSAQPISDDPLPDYEDDALPSHQRDRGESAPGGVYPFLSFSRNSSSKPLEPKSASSDIVTGTHAPSPTEPLVVSPQSRPRDARLITTSFHSPSDLHPQDNSHYPQDIDSTAPQSSVVSRFLSETDPGLLTAIDELIMSVKTLQDQDQSCQSSQINHITEAVTVADDDSIAEATSSSLSATHCPTQPSRTDGGYSLARLERVPRSEADSRRSRHPEFNLHPRMQLFLRIAYSERRSPSLAWPRRNSRVKRVESVRARRHRRHPHIIPPIGVGFIRKAVARFGSSWRPSMTSCARTLVQDAPDNDVEAVGEITDEVMAPSMSCIDPASPVASPPISLPTLTVHLLPRPDIAVELNTSSVEETIPVLMDCAADLVEHQPSPVEAFHVDVDMDRNCAYDSVPSDIPTECGNPMTDGAPMAHDSLPLQAASYSEGDLLRASNWDNQEFWEPQEGWLNYENLLKDEAQANYNQWEVGCQDALIESNESSHNDGYKWIADIPLDQADFELTLEDWSNILASFATPTQDCSTLDKVEGSSFEATQPESSFSLDRLDWGVLQDYAEIEYVENPVSSEEAVLLMCRAINLTEWKREWGLDFSFTVAGDVPIDFESPLSVSTALSSPLVATPSGPELDLPCAECCLHERLDTSMGSIEQDPRSFKFEANPLLVPTSNTPTQGFHLPDVPLPVYGICG